MHGDHRAPAKLEFRLAERADVPTILELLADDEISRQRGHGTVPEQVDAATWAAFEAIADDPGNELIVGVDGAEVVATCQLTFTPGLSRGGAWRMTIEAVRVRADRRGGGFGRQLMAYAVERARDRNCRIVQLTTDKRRTEARRFYESLGFTASHEGMKLPL
ncbi:GNAT family N-acetyltransferase [Actinoplanes sp. NPDC026619]|uniref:GNAT family N-acetyltransferase n=1 Tax=Actinoplanes sp. NPDC026619 TaxID=3155798 RepID=UPI0033C09E7B